MNKKKFKKPWCPIFSSSLQICIECSFSCSSCTWNFSVNWFGVCNLSSSWVRQNKPMFTMPMHASCMASWTVLIYINFPSIVAHSCWLEEKHCILSCGVRMNAYETEQCSSSADSIGSTNIHKVQLHRVNEILGYNTFWTKPFLARFTYGWYDNCPCVHPQLMYVTTAIHGEDTAWTIQLRALCATRRLNHLPVRSFMSGVCRSRDPRSLYGLKNAVASTACDSGIWSLARTFDYVRRMSRPGSTVFVRLDRCRCGHCMPPGDFTTC